MSKLYLFILSSFRICSATAQRLDGTWTVSVFDRSVQVNPDGSISISNIVLLDGFGASQQDRFEGFSDDFLRTTGFSLAGYLARCVASAFVQLDRGGQELIFHSNDILSRKVSLFDLSFYKTPDTTK